MRAWKGTISNAPNTYFVYLGGVPIFELDSSGAVKATNTFGLNGLISRHTSSGSTFYQFDERGNTVQRYDGLGNKLSSHEFDEFGALLSGSDALSDPYSGFGAQMGYYYDSETGFYLLGHRYYDPQAGRFLNQDPIGMGGGINQYAYTGNSPMSGADPSGLDYNNHDGQGFLGWWHDQVTRPTVGWFNAADAVAGFVFGFGPSTNVCGPNDWRTLDLKESSAGFNVEQDVIGSGYLQNGKSLRGSVTTPQGFDNTVFEPANGTQAQVGGFIYTAVRRGDTVYIHIYNEISMNSLFWHAFDALHWQGWDRSEGGFGPFGTVYQVFNYSLPVPEYWRQANTGGPRGGNGIRTSRLYGKQTQF